LIVASAIEGQCGVLYSEDLQDGEQIGGVTIALLQESANNNIVDASQPRGTDTTI
jgi:predicted nucleic acid-binding protein